MACLDENALCALLVVVVRAFKALMSSRTVRHRKVAKCGSPLHNSNTGDAHGTITCGWLSGRRWKLGGRLLLVVYANRKGVYIKIDHVQV